ncbi:MAG: HAMP domain-containing protein [Bacteroidetes bacterium]|nr:HAMP domain-containing protein [Bacteroidota bacterium]
MNIYVFLLAIAVFVTVVISSRITKPLLLIQEKMAGVRLGSINEKIAYQRNDEIGQLVHEYNRMLEELASSADKLAQSERESAWREMAKQVAHEIKNPLTPMKLSVQHLQRTMQHKDEQSREFVNRISDTLIQQIDTLSAITFFSPILQNASSTTGKTGPSPHHFSNC